MDEWQISLDYVRGSNISVRGSLDLRAWSLRLRTKTEENHYGKALFPSREGHFSFRWIRGILAIRRRACISLRRDISGGWAFDAEKHCVGWLAVWGGRDLLFPTFIVRKAHCDEAQTYQS